MTMTKVRIQDAFTDIKDDLVMRLGEISAQVLEPIDVKGFTEICHLEGEKRAMKRELEFLRATVEKMQNYL